MFGYHVLGFGIIDAVTNFFPTMAYSSNSLSVGSEAGNGSDIFVSEDGTKIYVLNDTDDLIYQYTLSTAFDASTGSYASKSLDTSSEDTLVRSLTFGDSGSKVYMTGQDNDAAFQYTLSTPWDVSTGSYASKSLDYSSETTSANAMALSADGTKMYILGASENAVYQYTLSTPWDASTGSYASKSLDISSEMSGTAGFGLTLNNDGTLVYALDNDTGIIYEYELSTPWDMSTGSYTSTSLDTSSEDANHKGIVMSSNNAHIYTIGDQNNTVFQYS